MLVWEGGCPSIVEPLPFVSVHCSVRTQFGTLPGGWVAHSRTVLHLLFERVAFPLTSTCVCPFPAATGWLAGWVGGWLGLAGSGWLAGLGWPAGRPARRVAHSAALLPPRCLSWRPSPLDLPPACVRLCHSTACCRVYYYWALQQERQGFVGEDGAYHPPRWQLREMLIRGMHHLL